MTVKGEHGGRTNVCGEAGCRALIPQGHTRCKRHGGTRPYTVVLYGGVNYTPGDVLFRFVEAANPTEAAKLAEKDARKRRHDYIFACFVFAAHHDDLLPAGYHAEDE